MAKPCDLEALLAAVAQAVGEAVPFNHSAAADAARIPALIARLQAGGATELQAARAREGVLLRAPSGHLLPLYWWQQRGVSYVGRYTADGAGLDPLGRFVQREAAIRGALRG